jgi:IclR family transcriptional regulator, acetate operon repressor
VQSVDRALQILLAFERDGAALRVTDLASQLDVHKSTASRLASTLEAQGFLERVNGTDAFRLGPRVVRLGMIAAGGRHVVAAARPAMEELAAVTGETVVLSVAAGDEAVDVAQVDSRFLVGGKRWIGLRSPLHATSDGKVLLAFGAAALPPGKLERVSARTITSLRALEQELDDVRRNGWARSVGEYEEGLNGVAAPIHDDDRCVAALSVSGPAYRVTEELLPDLASRCIEAANAVGWSVHAA